MSQIVPKENITRKLRGHIIMTSQGYLKVVGPKGKTEPYNPLNWKKKKGQANG